MLVYLKSHNAAIDLDTLNDGGHDEIDSFIGYLNTLSTDGLIA